jgi:hypothetical protein
MVALAISYCPNHEDKEAHYMICVPENTCYMVCEECVDWLKKTHQLVIDFDTPKIRKAIKSLLIK